MNSFDDAKYDGVWRVARQKDRKSALGADRESPLTKWMESEFAFRVKCPYCAIRLQRAVYYDGDGAESEIDDRERAPDLVEANAEDNLLDIVRLWSCARCSYWQYYSFTTYRADLWGYAAASVLRRFDPRVPEGCASEIAQHLRRNERLWTQLDAKGMELLVAQIFRANYREAEVVHVGRPGDLGVDVLYIDDGRTPWLVQVKRRKSNRATEGFKTLQKLLGTLVLKGEVHGIVASNADHFSYQAAKYAGIARDRGITIRLIDRGKLDRMLQPLLPEAPWKEFFSATSTTMLPLSLQQALEQKVLRDQRERLDASGSQPDLPFESRTDIGTR